MQSAEDEPGHVIFLTPSGVPFTQKLAVDLASLERLVFVCGRYEGIDERALSRADLELSIGDYVLTGGEIPAMAVIDAVSRHVPGVLGDDESCVDESFAEGLLEYPQDTRPRELHGLTVPEVLLGGDHARIARWRREQALCKTARVRPELLAGAALSDDEKRIVAGEPSRANASEER